MSDRAYIATRKGLFSLSRTAAKRWDLELIGFRGDPISAVLADPRDDRLYAALNLGHFGAKLHSSDDHGKSWRECGVPVYPAAASLQRNTTNDATNSAASGGASLQQIWSLAHAGEDHPRRLWAGTIPGGLFRSDDGGESWQLNQALWNVPERDLWFGGGYDEPGIHSICVDPRNSDHVAVAVSCGGLWVTTDGGDRWSCETSGMYANFVPPEQREEPAIQDPHCLVQCRSNPDVLWVQHHNGVFRSRDRARHWDDLSANTSPHSSFGFATAVHPSEPETAWLVPAISDECRLPQDGQLLVKRTRDGGDTFEALREGLPKEHAYDLIYRHALAVDDSGDRLLMGSTTGGLWISETQGDSWACVSTHLPPVYAVQFAL
jgi:hypothetical protein